MQSGISARALEFLILTATRTNEVINAKWCEIDLDATLWTIPAARMKTHREHRVPLPKRAITVLQEISAGRLNEYVRGTPRRAAAFEHGSLSIAQTHGLGPYYRTWIPFHIP